MICIHRWLVVCGEFNEYRKCFFCGKIQVISYKGLRGLDCGQIVVNEWPIGSDSGSSPSTEP